MSPSSPQPVEAEGRSFHIGSPFSLKLLATPNDSNFTPDGAATIRVPLGCCLRLSTATLCLGKSPSRADTFTLQLSSDEHPDPLNVCTFMPEISGIFTFSSLGIELSGDRTVRLWARDHLNNGGESTCDPSIHIFGSVVLDKNLIDLSKVYDTQNVAISDTENVNVSATNAATDETNTESMELDEVRNNESSAVPGTTNGDSVLLVSHENQDFDSSKADSKLSSVQRKKRRREIIRENKEAKKEERQQARMEKKQARIEKKQERESKKVSTTEEGCSTSAPNDNSNNDDVDAVAQQPSPAKKPVKKAQSPYSQRRLPCGVLVQDIIVGDGKLVKLGKIASVLYKGTLVSNGKVFDKNQKKNSPLQFRLGTGEVIRGMERGVEGMRVGGERTMIIPPSLGYGKKGAGSTIPGDATLEFTVQLLGVGPYNAR